MLDLIDAFEQSYKRDIQMRFLEAEVIAGFVGQLFEDSKDRKHIGPWDYFPSLFIEEKQKYEQQKEAEEWESFKDQRKAAIARFNQSRKGGE